MSKEKKGRGSKTHGGGSKKKRRGAGSRGGRGESGKKHKKIKYMKEKGEEEGGFQRPQTVKKTVNTINLQELDSKVKELLDTDKAKKKDSKIEVNLSKLGYDKLLGKGKVTHPLKVEAKDFSEKAKEKLEESGGRAIELS